MNLIIILRGWDFLLEIRQDGRVLDAEGAKYYHDLSDLLISTLDKLLKRNRLEAKALKTVKIQSDLSLNSTSYKIAEAFIGGLKT